LILRQAPWRIARTLARKKTTSKRDDGIEQAKALLLEAQESLGKEETPSKAKPKKLTSSRSEDKPSLSHLPDRIAALAEEGKRQLAQIQISLDDLSQEVEKIEGGVLTEYLRHGKASMDTAGKWLGLLGDTEFIAKKAEKSFPEKIAITFAILSDQGIKRLKEAKEYIESIRNIVKPPTPSIEIHPVTPEQVYEEQGELLPASRLSQIENNVAVGIPLKHEVFLRGQNYRILKATYTLQKRDGSDTATGTNSAT
jgi:hypothetical protein